MPCDLSHSPGYTLLPHNSTCNRQISVGPADPASVKVITTTHVLIVFALKSSRCLFGSVYNYCCLTPSQKLNVVLVTLSLQVIFPEVAWRLPVGGDPLTVKESECLSSGQIYWPASGLSILQLSHPTVKRHF